MSDSRVGLRRAWAHIDSLEGLRRARVSIREGDLSIRREVSFDDQEWLVRY